MSNLQGINCNTLILTNYILKLISVASTKRVENLKTASHSELLAVLKDNEADCARHQAYLDQLLLLVIERCPELLNTMSANPHNTRYIATVYYSCRAFCSWDDCNTTLLSTSLEIRKIPVYICDRA